MSRKNIAFSIATQYQFLFCYRLIAQESILSKIHIGSRNVLVISENHYFNDFMLSLPNKL